ncbi:ataxin-3-like, partial [Bombina bombina]
VQRSEASLEGDRLYEAPVMMDEDEENLQKALALSRQQIDMEDEEADLRRAIQLSMQGGHRSEFTELQSPNIPQSSGASVPASLSSEELRLRRQLYFEKQQQLKTEQTPQTHDATPDALNADSGKYFFCMIFQIIIHRIIFKRNSIKDCRVYINHLPTITSWH